MPKVKNFTYTVLAILAMVGASCEPSANTDRFVVHDVKSWIAKHPDSLVLFVAEGCPYCEFAVPIFDRVKNKFNQVSFIKIYIDSDRENMKKEFNFKTVPNFAYFKNKQQEFNHGSNNRQISKADVEANINKYILNQ